MSEGTVEELQEKVHQLEENLRKVKSVDELTRTLQQEYIL